MTVNFRGYVFQDDGDAVSGATVQLLETGTTTVEASTTTDSDGLWYFAESDQDRYDVKITSGTSVRYIRWDDQVSFKELDVRNNTGNTTPAATFSNITNNAANQVAVFSGANSTKADNDEIYLSFKMHDSAGNLDEFARMTVVATDVSTTTEDGQIEFDVMKAGTLTKVWTITSSTGAAMSFDMNVDALTIGSGADTDVSLTFDANSADGVITWMEDEDYFKFSDDILMNSTERINFYDTAIYIYSSTDGQLDLVADTEIQIAATTVDLNGNLDVSGTYTGAGLMTTGGNIVIPDAGNIGSASDTDAIAIASDGVVTMNQIPVFSAGINVSGGTIAGTLATAAQGNVTSLGTLTTLTVDNIITNGTNIGHTSDTDLMTLADGVLTIAGELDAATLDISGNADIDGTTNLDAVDIDGAVQIDATFTSGVDGQGYDTKFFGDTSGAYILWDTSADKLLTAGGAVVDIVKDKLLIGGTAVTTTAAELNVLDAVTAGTVSASLGVVVDSNKDIGSFRNITLTGELDAGSLDVSGNADIDGTLEADVITIDGTNVVTGSLITTLGTISAGVWEGTDVAVAHGGTGASSLTDGGVLLGSGTSAVTAMAVLADSEMIVGDGTTDPVAESGATLRTSIGVGTGDSPQFTDLTLTDDLILNSDGAVFSMGAGADFSITHDGSTAATIDVGGSGGSIVNVGGSNNDWTSSALTLGNGTQLQTKEGAWLKQAAESTSPHIYEVIGTTGAVSDATSTAVVDITIANQHQVGVLYLHYLTNSTAVDRVESGCIVMTFGRYQGSNTAWKIDADEASMPYSQGDNLTGSETITVTASAAIASGGTGATQVLQVSITSDNSNGVNAVTHWKANLMSSYAPAPNDSIYMTMAKA